MNLFKIFKSKSTLLLIKIIKNHNLMIFFHGLYVKYLFIVKRNCNRKNDEYCNRQNDEYCNRKVLHGLYP